MHEHIKETMELKNAPLDKITLHNWTVRDAPGEFLYIKKGDLKIDPAYQRQLNTSRRKLIQRDWSWVACGVLIVGRRDDGYYYVIDGQHRLAAALSRSDIQSLPCMVFTSGSRQSEAKGFVSTNTVRQAIRVFDKFKAKLVAKDPQAMKINALTKAQGIVISRSINKSENRKTFRLACISKVEKAFKRLGEEKFLCLLEFLKRLYSDEDSLDIDAPIFGGFFHLLYMNEGVFFNAKFQEKACKKGIALLLKAGKTHTVLYGESGDKAWGTAIVTCINKGSRKKFPL